MRVERIRALDGLRGVAVSLVMCAHYYGLLGVKNGGRGVDIFFVLSGFLITRILLSEFDISSSISFRRFYARRALRLLPALVVCVLLFGAVDFFVAQTNNHNLPRSMGVALLLYLSNWVRAFQLWNLAEFGHTWSLAIEDQFYLVWPLLLLLALRFLRSRASIAALLFMAFILVEINRYAAISAGESRIWTEAATQFRIDGLLLGAIAALLCDRLSPNRTSRILGIAAGAILIFCFSVKAGVASAFWLQVLVS
ncbi:MAG: acyltransferase, partial [Proteobacteria bacterium]|nr:acyltransferase [Pseudomonadota bacterium]